MCDYMYNDIGNMENGTSGRRESALLQLVHHQKTSLVATAMPMIYSALRKITRFAGPEFGWTLAGPFVTMLLTC